MTIIYLLLAISILVAVFFFIAFVISVRNGQYDDTYTPSIRMLFEDELIEDVSAELPKTKNQKPKTKTLTTNYGSRKVLLRQ